mmetsp:Transcript_6014/g.19637  ORF Transcript_6014/g.19637 Transcript_6014/m.19637 type:complete len:257 (+) Transcript_6014:118-888(+)
MNVLLLLWLLFTVVHCVETDSSDDGDQGQVEDEDPDEELIISTTTAPPPGLVQPSGPVAIAEVDRAILTRSLVQLGFDKVESVRDIRCPRSINKAGAGFSWLSCNGRGAITQVALVGRRLSGSLPPALGQLTSLYALSLSANLLTGTLPPQWANATSLLTLDVRQNFLTGTLPPQWSSLSRLTLMHLRSNQLHGRIPSSWRSLPAYQRGEVFLYDNDGLTYECFLDEERTVVGDCPVSLPRDQAYARALYALREAD